MPEDSNFLVIVAYFKTLEIPDLKPACASSVGVRLFVNVEDFQDKCAAAVDSARVTQGPVIWKHCVFRYRTS